MYYVCLYKRQVIRELLNVAESFFISGYKPYEETFEKQDQWLSKLAW